IAATTWAEYKRHIEKDPALTRRFQAIMVAEPDEAGAIEMMRGMVQTLEQHHGVEILDAAVQAAVTLSHRSLPARQLPDKCLGVLDTACARVAVSQHTVAVEIEQSRRRIAALEMTLGMMQREAVMVGDDPARIAPIERELGQERAALASLEARHATEAELVGRIRSLRQDLRTMIRGSEEVERLRSELRDTQAALAATQGERPLVLPMVDRHAVAAVVQDWTGVPVGRMVRDDVETVLTLDAALAGRVVGQD